MRLPSRPLPVLALLLSITSVWAALSGARAKADPRPTPGPRDFLARSAEDIRTNCLGRDFAQVACEEIRGQLPLAEGWRDRRVLLGRTSPLEWFAGSVVQQGWHGTQRAAGEVRASTSATPPSAYVSARAAREAYASLRDQVVAQATRQRLKECQKACLATCVSSRFLDYDDRESGTLAHWKDAVENQKGVCRDFARIGVNLMRKLGLDAVFASGNALEIPDSRRPGDAMQPGGGHALVSVKLDGHRYLTDPQTDMCQFFPERDRPIYRPEPAAYLEGTGP